MDWNFNDEFFAWVDAKADVLMMTNLKKIIKKQILRAWEESNAFAKKHRGCKHPQSQRMTSYSDEEKFECCNECRTILKATKTF